MVGGPDGRARTGRRSRHAEQWLELQYSAGRYVALIYSASGSVQREQAFPSLSDATTAYERLVAAVIDGRVDPSQPVFREDLDD